MNLQDFPLLILGLDNANDVSARLLATKGRERNVDREKLYRDRLDKAIADLTDGVEEGAIANVAFKAAKEEVNRSIETAYNALFRNKLMGGETGSAENELYYMMYPQAHTINGFIKKVQKLNKAGDIEIAKSIVDFCEQVKPLCDAITTLKDKVVKRQPRSEEEKAAAIYTPPPSNSKAVAKVQAILEDIVAKAYDGLLASLYKGNQRMLANYMKAQAGVEAGTYERSDGLRAADKAKRFSFSPYDYFTVVSNGRRQVDSISAGLIDDCVERKEARDVRPDDESVGYYDTIYVQKPDADAILHAAAVKDANHIRTMYVVKNLKKIVSVLEAKGDALFLSAEEGQFGTSLRGLQGEIIVRFKDGSSFRVNNDVVFVVNSYGTRFNRFPLTFHDVVMPDGSKMKGPSEKNMNTVFVGKAS